MQSKTWVRLRWLASGLALACAWFDVHLREAPRPQLASYDWRRTVDGWEEIPRWQAPQNSIALRPLMVASLLLGVSAMAISPRTAAEPIDATFEPAAE